SYPVPCFTASPWRLAPRLVELGGIRPSEWPSRGRDSDAGNKGKRVAMKSLKPILWSIAVLLLAASAAPASEGSLAIPDLHKGRFFTTPGDPNSGISAWNLLFYGSFVIAGTLGISL